MEYGLFDFLQLIGALGLFIYGMKLMSEGIQKIAGNQLRVILRSMTSNKYLGILTGFFVTAMIQSSSATTVMVVSFVNAGLLTLVESFGVIMGANIGTTVTIWVVNYLGLKVKMAPIAVALIGMVFPLLFAKKDKLKNFAEFVIGFGILFIGLTFLKDAVPDLKSNPEILSFLNQFANPGLLARLLFVGVGTVLTVVVQSSSAASAITLIMLAEGWIGFDLGAAMILGENVGTTITANLAALIANVHAKRAARFHFVFNVTGVIWMLLLMPFFIQFIETYLPFTEANDKLPVFHTMFNITNVVVLMWFTPIFYKIVLWMVPSKGEDDEEFKLQYIKSGLLGTPEIMLAEAKKETQNYGEVLTKITNNVIYLLFENPKDRGDMLAKIKKREENTDTLEIEIADFLAKVSEDEMSTEGANRIQSLMSIINDMERYGDICYEISLTNERIMGLGANISNNVRDEIQGLFALVKNQLKLTNEHLNQRFKNVDLDVVRANEKVINEKRTILQKLVFKSMEKTVITAPEGIHYMNIINSAEKLGDHLVNINEAIAGIK